MEYENQLSFAKRTCEIYFETKQLNICQEYNFTHALGCLLNIISVIRPDDVFIINVENVIPGKTLKQTEHILTVIRNGLAHPYGNNKIFDTYDKKIISVSLAHHDGQDRIEEMTYEDIDQLVQKLYEKIKEELS